MINAIELPPVHYFWVLPDEDVREKLDEVQARLGEKLFLLVTWETYCELRLEFSLELVDHTPPDFNCLDIFVLRTPQGNINIMVTR